MPKEVFTPKSFWNPRAYDKYKEFRDKLSPNMQSMYDAEVYPECDCDYGSSYCPHMGKAPDQVYDRLMRVVRAYEKDRLEEDIG